MTETDYAKINTAIACADWIDDTDCNRLLEIIRERRKELKDADYQGYQRGLQRALDIVDGNVGAINKQRITADYTGRTDEIELIARIVTDLQTAQ